MTKKRSYRLVVIFSLLLVMFVNTAAAAFTKSADEIQNEIGDKQAQQSEIDDKLEVLQQQIAQQKETDAQITAEMAKILAEKQVYESEMQKMLSDLDYIYQQIEDFQKSIEETEKNYNEALVLFYNRARVM